MSDMNVQALNRQRNMIRYTVLGIAALELIAVVMIIAGLRLPGILLGFAGIVGGSVFKRRGKRQYAAACGKEQALHALHMTDVKYIGQSRESTQWILDTHLVPSSTDVVQNPLVQGAVQGTVKGSPLWLSEVTFGVMESGKRQPTFSSGVMVQAKLAHPVEKETLLLGRIAFKHSALRAEYEKDGMRLSNAGSKEKGWYALTPDANAPETRVIEGWEPLCAAVNNRAVMHLKGKTLTAFFYGCFYTGEFTLDEPVTEAMLRRHHFDGYKPLANMIEKLNNAAE